MNNLSSLSRGLLFFIISTFLFLSCEDDKQSLTVSERLLISKWQKVKQEKNGEVMMMQGNCLEKKDYWVCKINRTIVEIVHTNQCQESMKEMSWSLDDDKFTIVEEDAVGGVIERVYKVLSLTSTELVLQEQKVTHKISKTIVDVKEEKDGEGEILYLDRLEFLAGGGF